MEDCTKSARSILKGRRRLTGRDRMWCACLRCGMGRDLHALEQKFVSNPVE